MKYPVRKKTALICYDSRHSQSYLGHTSSFWMQYDRINDL